MQFVQGQSYKREVILAAVTGGARTVVGGDWATGYATVGEDTYVFCNVGVPGRTGHDYPNRWLGRDLHWFGKPNSKEDQPQIGGMLRGRGRVHIFWRGTDRSPFTYAGEARPLHVWNQRPVEVLWTFEAASQDHVADDSQQWRRGPPPTFGEISAIREDGPTSLYLMVLEPRAGSSEARSLKPNSVFVKVGISNQPQRRLGQMNSGFPPTFEAAWRLVDTVPFHNGMAAYYAEGLILERLRVTGRWVGGEFGLVPADEVSKLLPLRQA